MAGAEARAVWQRTANRCFVQEDAKRAPKLACCQSSSATTKLVDAGPASAAEGTGHIPTGFMPFAINPSFTNVSPHTMWWLHQQPDHGYEMDLNCEQLNELEHVRETSNLSNKSTLSASGELQLQKEVNITSGNSDKDQDSCLQLQFVDAISEGLDVQKIEGFEKNNQAFVKLMDTKKTYNKMEMDPITCSVSEKSYGIGPNCESPWLKVNKNEPWWRTSDRDELAFLVFHKSLEHIENCDLPPPQKYVCRRRDASSNDGKKMTASIGWESKYESSINLPAYAQNWSDYESKNEKPGVPAYEGHFPSLSHMSSRYSTSRQSEVNEKMKQLSGEDLGKDKLLEALCHSQTRAREAKEAAKRAYAEKDDIAKLLFRQASQLFAYKQWFQLLQLETACFQIKSHDLPISTLFPPFLPWMSYLGRRSWKRWQKVSKTHCGRRVRSRNNFTTYTIAFALGLSLVGAGLLLGWTVGWMFPPL